MKKFRKDSKDGVFKIRYEWLDPYFIEQMAIVSTYGGNKYGPYNWQSASQEELKHYEGALMRHLQEHRMGRFIDDDHGQSHMSSVALNAMFLDWFRRKYSWGLNNR